MSERRERLMLWREIFCLLAVKGREASPPAESIYRAASSSIWKYIRLEIIQCETFCAAIWLVVYYISF